MNFRFGLILFVSLCFILLSSVLAADALACTITTYWDYGCPNDSGTQDCNSCGTCTSNCTYSQPSYYSGFSPYGGFSPYDSFSPYGGFSPYSQSAYAPTATPTPSPVPPTPTPPVGQCIQLVSLPTLGLVSYYKMDETSGTTAADSVTSSNNNGNAAVGATVDNYFKLGQKARKFDGTSNGYINLNNPATLQTNQLSISAWVKRTSLATVQTILGYGAGGYTLYLAADNKITFGKSGGSTVSCQTLTDSSTYHHIVVTYDNTNSNVKCYLDNVASSTLILNPGLLTFTTNLSIGATSGSSNFFNGWIDEVGIWNKALVPSEVTKIYNMGYGVQLALVPFNDSENVAGVSIENLSEPSLLDSLGQAIKNVIK